MLRRNMRAYHPFARVVIPAITPVKRATIESVGATSFQMRAGCSGRNAWVNGLGEAKCGHRGCCTGEKTKARFRSGSTSCGGFHAASRCTDHRGRLPVSGRNPDRFSLRRKRHNHHPGRRHAGPFFFGQIPTFRFSRADETIWAGSADESRWPKARRRALCLSRRSRQARDQDSHSGS